MLGVFELISAGLVDGCRYGAGGRVSAVAGMQRERLRIRRVGHFGFPRGSSFQFKWFCFVHSPLTRRLLRRPQGPPAPACEEVPAPRGRCVPMRRGMLDVTSFGRMSRAGNLFLLFRRGGLTRRSDVVPDGAAAAPRASQGRPCRPDSVADRSDHHSLIGGVSRYPPAPNTD